MKFILGHNNAGREMKSERWKHEDHGHDTPCWIWQLKIGANGYGYAKVRTAQRLAHRIVYENANGPIPEALELDHLCRVTACVNPDHLEPVTGAVNSYRSSATKLNRESAGRLITDRDGNLKEIARRYGVSESYARMLRNGTARPRYLYG